MSRKIVNNKEKEKCVQNFKFLFSVPISSFYYHLNYEFIYNHQLLHSPRKSSSSQLSHLLQKGPLS